MKYYKAFSTKPDPDNSAFIIDDLNGILNSLQTNDYWQIERVDCHEINAWSCKKQMNIPCLQYIVVGSHEDQKNDKW